MHSLLAAPLRFPIRPLILTVILWAGLICVAEVNASEVEGEFLLKGVSEQREFDYFKLALQWPGTYCRTTKKCCSQNGCCRGSNGPTGFTIHGLWADYNDGSWPSCCSGKSFDVKEVKTLLAALNTYWPSLSCSNSKNCHGGKGIFWEHEELIIAPFFLSCLGCGTSGIKWEKHGTCSASVTGDEYNYFLTTLNLYFKYNVTEILSEAGYVASNSEKYPIGGIISAIENVFQATPEIECSGDAVEELYLCFYKDFKPRDCVLGTSTNSGSCPRYVSLPILSSSKVGHRHNEAEVPHLTLQSSM